MFSSQFIQLKRRYQQIASPSGRNITFPKLNPYFWLSAILCSSIILTEWQSMSLKAKQQPDSELDHIRQTQADLVSLLGETRAEMRQGFEEISQRFEQVDQRFEQVDQRFEHVDRRFDKLEQEQVETRKDIARLELLIRQLLPNSNN